MMSKAASDKFVRKYMRMAALLAEDVPCLSRGIGSVIVNPTTNTIISTGYNGVIKGGPDADSYSNLCSLIYPQLTEKDKKYIGLCTESNINFAARFEDCGECPRRLVGAKSGERLDLCASCVHSEQNAINNAARNGHATDGCYLFCACSVPCINCSKSIINAGIIKVYCWNKENSAYGEWRSELMFKWVDVELIKLDKKWIND